MFISRIVALIVAGMQTRLGYTPVAISLCTEDTLQRAKEFQKFLDGQDGK